MRNEGNLPLHAWHIPQQPDEEEAQVAPASPQGEEIVVHKL